MKVDSNKNLVDGRKCGECEACCFVSEIKEGILDKPSCQKCPFQKNGCSIFGEVKRPKVCSSFQCGWLRGAGKEEDRPDKSGVMVSINQMNGGTWIMVMDLEQDAHKTTGKNMVIEMINRFDFPAIVVDHKNLEKGKGDYVIIKKTLEERAGSIKGKHITQLDNDINIYKLIISK